MQFRDAHLPRYILMALSLSFFIHICMYLPGFIRMLKYRGHPSSALSDLRSPLVVFYRLETVGVPATNYFLNFTAINATSIFGGGSKLEYFDADGHMKYIQYLDLWDCLYFPVLPELFFVLVAFGISILLQLALYGLLLLKWWPALLLTFITVMDFLGLFLILWLLTFIDGSVSSFVSRPNFSKTPYEWLEMSHFNSKYTFGFYIYIFNVLIVHGILAFLAIRNVRHIQQEKLIHQI